MNAHLLYDGLKALGLTVGRTASPVVAVEMEDRSRTIDCWKALMEDGVYVNLVIPPASPSTNFLLRNSVSAAHNSAQLDTIIAAYASLKTAGLITSTQAA